MMRSKRAEISTSTLIIIIASILILVVVISAIFSYLDFFSSEGYNNVKFTSNYVSTGVEITSVEGSDGRNEYFDEYFVNIKSVPDSQPINLEGLNVLLKTKYSNALLSYRNGTPVFGPGGYETLSTDYFLETTSSFDYYEPTTYQIQPNVFAPLNIDLDGDGINDEVATCDGTLCDPSFSDIAIVFNLSTAGLQYSYLNDTSGNLVNISSGIVVPINISYSYIGSETDPYGFITTYDTKPLFPAHILVADPGTGPFYVYGNPTQLANDLDGDGVREWSVLNDTHLRIFPTSERISIDVPLGTNISSGSSSLDIEQDLNLSNGTFIGTIVIDGSARFGIISEDAIQITPTASGVGWYQVQYLITSDSSHQQGFINRGETVKIFVDAPYKMQANDEISFNFVTPRGVSFPITVFTGHTIKGANLVNLYPRT